MNCGMFVCVGEGDEDGDEDDEEEGGRALT